MYVDGHAYPDASIDEKERLERLEKGVGICTTRKRIISHDMSRSSGTCTHLPNVTTENMRKKIFKIHTKYNTRSLFTSHNFLKNEI